FSCFSHHPSPPSFPTRRSSDLSAALEYRAPLFAPSRGFRFVPVFIDRTSLSIFGETGRAYCPNVVTNGVCRSVDVSNPAMTSLGDRKSTRLNSSHQIISYAVLC